MKFRTVLESLNENQRKAVDHYGAAFMLAGPGTGKTQTLAAKAINLILGETQASPELILCLTFTDSGAISMRRRLRQFIGETAHKVAIHTFHSFCNEIIQYNIDRFRMREIKPVSELEAIQILYEILQDLNPDHPLSRLKGDVYYEVTRMKDLFRIMKEEGWSYQFMREQSEDYIRSLPEREEYIYQRANKKKNIVAGDVKKEKVAEETEKVRLMLSAAELFPVYNRKLVERERFDFADMIHWVIREFKDNPNFLLNYQERYQYVLVDEFQDTSGSQMTLLRQLIDFWDDPYVFVVGDEDQTLYEWNGARVKNMTEFIKDYNPAVIPLLDNYRSDQPILNHARSLINKNNIRLIKDKKLSSHSKTAIEPEVIEFESVIQEEMWIVNRVVELIEQGIPPGEIGIIYRKHRIGENVMRDLQSRDIPVFVRKKINILNENVIIQLLKMIEYFVRDHESPGRRMNMRLLFEICHYDYFKLKHEDIRHFVGETILPDSKEFEEFTKLVNYLKTFYANQPVTRFVIELMNKTGLMVKAKEGDFSRQNMNYLYSFYNWLRAEVEKNPLYTGSDLISDVEKMRERGVSVDTIDMSFTQDGVCLTTCHGAKGLEFEHVFMMGCTSSHWEKSRGFTQRYKIPDTLTYTRDEDKDESNRRLFYVSMTRAKRFLNILYSKKDEAGKELEPTKYIDEAELTDVRTQYSDIVIDTEDRLMARMGIPTFKADYSVEYLKETVENFVLSPSSLNTFLRCRLSFFYEYIAKAPFAVSDALVYGNAIHYAMKQVYDRRKSNDSWMDVKAFVKLFQEELMRNKGQLTDEEYSRRKFMGEKVLPEFYQTYVLGSNPITLNEYKFTRININGVPFRGDIDKMEFEGNNVVVVDYKTGRPKSTLAEMKYGGSIWRQLMSYGLMVNNLHTKEWKVKDYAVVLIDEEGMGPIFLDEELVDLETVAKEIKEVHERIQALDFREGCGDPRCYWCNFEKSLLI